MKKSDSAAAAGIGLISLILSTQVISDHHKEVRSKLIPHTCSRKGMARLAEDMVMCAFHIECILTLWVCVTHLCSFL